MENRNEIDFRGVFLALKQKLLVIIMSGLAAKLYWLLIYYVICKS